MTRPQILFLDAYDSFTNNIVSLLITLLDADVHVLPIDTPLLDQNSLTFSVDFHRELSRYHAVVCGPGPGSAENETDVGLMRCIWRLQDEHLLPVLGICLGFQSLVLSSGGNVRRLQRGMHGMVRDIQHEKSEATCAEDIFGGVSEFKATLYHSLCADIGQDSIPDSTWASRRWRAQEMAPELLPLAWVDEQRDSGRERILMAVKHKSKPFWGLQYHPESVCTQPAGHAVISNWLREAMAWNRKANRNVLSGERFLARNAVKPSLLCENHVAAQGGNATVLEWTEMPTPLATVGLDCEYIYKTISLPANVKVPDIVEVLKSGRMEHIILDSSNSSSMATGAADVRGRFSVVALDVEESLRIEHHVGDDFATARIPSIQGLPVDLVETVPFGSQKNIWHLLSGFLEKRRIPGSEELETPFRGGFMGYLTYEMGLKGIDVAVAADRGHQRPDLCFAWVTKSIVVDHVKGLLHVQHLQKRKLNANFWIDSVVASLQTSHLWQASGKAIVNGSDASTVATRPVIRVPAADEYEAKVSHCQEFIAAGESYELCLTDQTTITLPGRPTKDHAPAATNGLADGHPSEQGKSAYVAPWKLYKTLRARQPAPFGSFIRLGGATLISSSPERFLEYDAHGFCSMRPMKGTVRKSNQVATLAQAEEILHVPKEEAENLMIVDLVRHDLHGVCGSGNVTVPHLMKVEEYATVFQMITIVNGQLPQPTTASGADRRHTGLDVLAASLPPGSMTGAPKKRSCELLQEIEEHKERGLYSGVVGYMDVTGKGDWSVTIRTMFKWDDENAPPEEGETEPREVWHIGAGGAVTILSTAEGEREEMFTKLAGPLGVFADV
ncbi:aminodeoxychorismate synthase [Colletotrichum orchidophilum]|uniref:aminodeoxychorismate synthase n=1 Tax=Colletotrichum orchidophilum TaxID=1209926 RepID=A0A1G4B1V7_9PEZI|nr:aminodeoxychorismate synthase [Colletotrichum orchidophilum]OHE95400.1 aminodeoxychorismate synthase [Colletotrichum orchidophilum]